MNDKRRRAKDSGVSGDPPKRGYLPLPQTRKCDCQFRGCSHRGENTKDIIPVPGLARKGDGVRHRGGKGLIVAAGWEKAFNRVYVLGLPKVSQALDS